jgi:2-oxoglutarate ferredoxin oxidoreductase subunit alpha
VVDGCAGREPRVVKSLYVEEGELEAKNCTLQKKYQLMRDREVLSQAYETEDAELIIVAFGIAARIAMTAVGRLRRQGRRVGFFRPVTLFPFPEKELRELSLSGNRRFMVVELNAGQMVEDVKLSVLGRAEVLFYGRPGGAVITPGELQDRLLEIL